MTVPSDLAGSTTAGESAAAVGQLARGALHWRVRPSTLLGYLSVMIAAAATLYTTRLLFHQQDANFDLRHYHAYLGWSVFHGGPSRDLHPAAVGSYLNPGLDLFNYVTLTQVPASIGTTLLLVIHLSSAIPVYGIARLLMPSWPRTVAVATAILSLGGALVTSEWGTTFGDLTAAPLVLWGLWLLLGATPHSSWQLLVGGGLVGAATGLKLTNALFGLASLAMVAVVAPRLRALALWFVGLGLGFVVAAGPWMVVMWRENRNPLFPYLNAFFQSPYGETATTPDARFGGNGLGDVLLYPFRLVAAPAGFSSELPSSDWRWPVWALSVVITGTLILLQLPGAPLAKASFPPSWSIRSTPFRRFVALQMFCLVAFALWAVVFGIQRYAIVIELLTVPLAVTTLALLTTRRVFLQAALIVFAVGLGLNTQTINWGRIDMPSGPAIPQGSVSTLQGYEAIILAATPPSSFVAVAVGGDNSAGTRPAWFGQPSNAADLRRAMDRFPDGRIGVLVRSDASEPMVAAAAAAAWYGLRIASTCTPVPVPLLEAMLICDTSGD